MVRIPLNDLKRHHQPLAAALESAVIRVLAAGWYILGPELAAFEAEFAAYCGAAQAIGVANGTDALELALRALEVAPGAEVATVANAGMYGTTAILRAGATPVFVDVDPDSMMMSPPALESALSSRTAAVIVTHLYGAMAAVDEVAAIAAKHGIPLIEDCSHSPGASRHGRKTGCWGSLACFSFYPTKNLGAAGDAGAIVTSDAALAARVRSLRQYGWSGKYDASAPGGRNSRLDEMQAAVLRTKLPYLDRWNSLRREVAAAYCDALSNCSLVLPRYVCGSDYVGHLFVIRSRHRERIRQHLSTAGIGTDVHYPIPDHRQRALDGVPFRSTPLPVSERCAAEILTLPCFPELTREEVREVALRVGEAVHSVEAIEISP